MTWYNLTFAVNVILNCHVETIDYNSRNDLTYSEAITRLDYNHMNAMTQQKAVTRHD